MLKKVIEKKSSPTLRHVACEQGGDVYLPGVEGLAGGDAVHAGLEDGQLGQEEHRRQVHGGEHLQYLCQGGALPVHPHVVVTKILGF